MLRGQILGNVPLYLYLQRRKNSLEEKEEDPIAHFIRFTSIQQKPCQK